MRLAIALPVMLSLAVQAQAATIELRNPTYPSPWCLPIFADEPISFSVLLHPEGATDIIGASLCISGVPSGCSATAIPSPGASAFEGDPFSNAGAQILFASPQTSESVALCEVTLLCPGTALGSIVILWPAAPLLASPFPRCPFVVIRGVPEPTYACANYNYLSKDPLRCEIGVTPISWGTTKLLFK